MPEKGGSQKPVANYKELFRLKSEGMTYIGRFFSNLISIGS
jgi:hypothetical protein